MNDFDKKLDLIESKYGSKVFKQMYKELILNIASLEAATPKYILEKIIEDVDSLLEQ